MGTNLSWLACRFAYKPWLTTACNATYLLQVTLLSPQLQCSDPWTPRIALWVLSPWFPLLTSLSDQSWLWFGAVKHCECTDTALTRIASLLFYLCIDDRYLAAYV